MRVFVAIFATVVLGCSGPGGLDPECRRAADCPSGFCVTGECVSLDAGTRDANFVRYLDVPFRTADARSPGGPPCENALPPTAENLILNEILVNVPTGPAGDANGDGVRDAFDDEFIELVNVADAPIDMRRVEIRNGGRLRFSFGALCLPAGESVVVFGGGAVSPRMPGNSIASPDRFAFGNEGGRIVVTGPVGTIATLDYGRAPPASYTRTPQLSGSDWIDHREFGAAFSPGRCAGGGTLAEGCHAVAEPTDAGAPD